jgi:hypothetical protein
MSENSISGIDCAAVLNCPPIALKIFAHYCDKERTHMELLFSNIESPPQFS